MLLPYLIAIFIILGVVVIYIYILAPKMNPYNRADNYLAQDMVDEAILEFKKILDLKPNDFTVHYRLAEIYLKKNEIDQAVIHLEDIIRINKFNYEVEKYKVLKKLGEAYLSRGETERAFLNFLNVLKQYPTDVESLYHVSFISLGQEYFDFSQRYFERLINLSRKNFEVSFGAGIAFYQNHKANEAAACFKEALAQEPHSDIANIAMAFTQQRRRDYKTAVNYVKMVVDNSRDPEAVFIAKRMLGLLFVQAKNPKAGVRVFEDLLDHARNNDLNEEIPMLLYDTGFAFIRAEMTDQAYEYWDQLYQMDNGYKEVRSLTAVLKREMEIDQKYGTPDMGQSVLDYYDNWINDFFPKNYLWAICGLKSENPIDIKEIIERSKTTGSRVSGDGVAIEDDVYAGDILARFSELNIEQFRIVANRVVSKMGYAVDEILTTYREADGVDFLAHSLAEKEKILIWVRRWKGTNVGEIPLRNFAQAINDIKAKNGLFITATDLTPSAEGSMNMLSKVTVVYPDQLSALLADLI
ncbi:MAG: restriction endonuclease [Spirochaetes bacterium]|jgi:tetratricopeptide (TPR) repeat protein|nr:restriction endonuclease [Spirochaetota bacterium]